MERQNTFGWLVSIDLFLGGAGGGVFLISFIMELINKYEPLARIGAIVGTALVIIGAFFLLLDLGNKTKSYRLFFRPSSWMTRGTWFITMFVIFSLAYSLPAFWINWEATAMPAVVIGVLAAMFAVLVMVYTGFLFSAAKRVPFWTSSALPLLFFFTSLYTGMAILLLIAGFYQVIPGETLRPLVIAEVVLVLMQLLALGTSLGVARHGGAAAKASVRLLVRRPSFITGAIGAGLIIPLALLVYVGVGGHSLILGVLSAIFILIGGFLLRYGILKAGVYTPLYPP